MSLRMRQATMGGGFVVTRWCGGIRLAPAGDGPEHILAQTPIYLDSNDLVQLLAFCMDDCAEEVLHEEVAAFASEWLAKRRIDRDGYDAVESYWDRQP